MIVIPMAGVSRRFAMAGYDRPKYMLEAHGKTLFRHAVESFQALFAEETFLFVCRDVADTPAFIRAECAAMGVGRYEVVGLHALTRGQAETVALGLSGAGCPDAEPILVFNIDTFRPGFAWPGDVDRAAADGYLEVFDGSGPQWSYVGQSGPGSNRVAETAEKREISNLCCTGLYWFRSAGLFRAAYAEQLALGLERAEAGELYVAPLYNFLIRRGADIRYHRIPREAVIFCGVPQEYEDFLHAS
ncbi:glycosyltransferase family 2 protein [Azospirillum sp.]|uniref:glycosyltransferase family 2 protein n=1 Tax=Azospirillum sp. TaxID=34012 RepID=UPI002D3DBC04|nr:glycosyltransferase family 2 protein [Azospirillum sp.]HYD68017.1 glycosyltransferase family 2 protein [Azospirillum sp.]